MLTNRAYYLIKPLLPGRFRLALRRYRAKTIFKNCEQTWPIYDPSGKAPEGWTGWPNGKQSSIVLTHDVECQRGLDRCRQLAEIEMEYGFRSSFNFIPNGDYEVPEELLGWLRSNGFEVGVHDLRHDGTLFQSREQFQKDAIAINHQLKTWGAVGFRAGFMLHKLDWFHDLNIEYDASTFDVDPFEPQPDGAQTIFPFWVPAPNPEADALRHNLQPPANEPKGYIELPYTLIQDYNLFVVLKQNNIDIWKKKLRWLVGKGAMALLDTHPDYMTMKGEKPSYNEYPVQYYRDFLEHIRTEYTGQYWAALPREVAAFCRPLRPKQARPPRRVVMLAHNYYEYDNRIRRYAETLVKQGDEVKILSLGTDEQVKAGRWEKLNGVDFLCIQSRPRHKETKWKLILRFIMFLYRATLQLNSKNLRNGCDLFHVHNIPDFLVFAGLGYKLRATPIILDIRDKVPEFYECRFGMGKPSVMSRGLRLVEKWSCQFSSHVIIANHIWKKLLLEKTLPPSRLTALVNNVDFAIFSRKPRTRTDDRIILIYPGTLNYHQGLDIAINAMVPLSREFPKIELHIYGVGPTLEALKTQAQNLNLANHVQFFSPIRLEEVSNAIANADIGIVPKRASGFGDQAYSTKIMEFMSQALPAVVSRTTIDMMYFNDSVVSFFEPENSEDLARAVRQVLTNPEYRQQLSENGFEYAQANSWETVKNIYLDLVDRLTMTAIPRQ